MTSELHNSVYIGAVKLLRFNGVVCGARGRTGGGGRGGCHTKIFRFTYFSIELLKFLTLWPTQISKTVFSAPWLRPDTSSLKVGIFFIDRKSVV